VQTLYKLPEGHHLKLTTAGWYTPSGRSISRPHELEGRLLSDAEGAAPVEEEVDEAAADSSANAYHTAAGRVVHGGGGITPDVTVVDSLTAREQEFAEALGRGSFSLNQLAVRFAAEWNADHPGLRPDFEVSSEMRDEFYRLLLSEDVELDPGLYSDVQPLVDRFLAAQLANSAFGESERLRRAQAGNAQVARAVELLRGASTTADLFSAAGTNLPGTGGEAIPGVAAAAAY
jgi:carboxyl-terminal processing protease